MRTCTGTLAALALGIMSCRAKDSVENRVVQRWLLCDECVEGELDSVLALRSRGEKAMIKALEGPPKDRVENMRLQAEGMYARIPHPATPRQKFVDHYVGNYRAIYHRRAEVALRRFNTPTAHSALVDALRHDTRYRDDVLRGLAEAAGVSLSVTAGDRQQAPVDSFVRINPTVLVRDTITAQPLSGVRVAFQVDSGGGVALPPSQVTSSDGKAIVRWQMGPSDSTNVLRASAAGQAVRFIATGHQPGWRVVFLVQPGDAVRSQPVTPPARIAVQDSWGSTLTNFNQTAVVRILPINVQMTRNIVDGVATLSGLVVDQAGTGFKLRVTAIGASPVESNPFDVVVGP
jgi:hypothetical protein